LRLQPVEIRIVEIEWIQKDLKKFYKFLKTKNDSALFENELIKVLLMNQNYSG
jgi:hypothetical protein